MKIELLFQRRLQYKVANLLKILSMEIVWIFNHLNMSEQLLQLIISISAVQKQTKKSCNVEKTQFKFLSLGPKS